MNSFVKINLAQQFLFLRQQVEKLEIIFIKKRHQPEKWSIHEHLAHLGRYQEIFLERMAIILGQDSPRLKQYKADHDQCFYDWCQLEMEDILIKMALQRKKIIAFLNDLTIDQAVRKGIHPRFGIMNVQEWTLFFLLHESHHIYSIFRLKQQFLK